MSEAFRAAIAGDDPDAIAVAFDRVTGPGAWGRQPDGVKAALRPMARAMAADSGRTCTRSYSRAELAEIVAPTTIVSAEHA